MIGRDGGTLEEDPVDGSSSTRRLDVLEEHLSRQHALERALDAAVARRRADVDLDAAVAEAFRLGASVSQVRAYAGAAPFVEGRSS